MAEPPAVDPASPTGYSLGRRTLILASGEDGLQWIMQTQAMLAGGGARIHHVDYDNAPTGRATYWASPFRWWLAALAGVKHAASGQPLGAAVEWAALYANPLLLGLLLVGVIPLVARRFGSTAAIVLALGFSAAIPFRYYFAADYPDHHGILEACGMLTVLFLAAGGGGLVRVGDPAGSDRAGEEGGAVAWLPSPGSARRWFVASALAGGFGMWISAASEIPVLLGLGIGALGSVWWLRAAPPGRAWQCQPELWRVWGIVGGAASLAAYLVEYFPSHLGFRLEVNHPLYALAWLGAGELLCRWCRMWTGGRLRFSWREVAPALAAAAAVAVAPVIILFTKDQTFVVANQFVWRLGTQHVAEGESLGRLFARIGSHPLQIARFLPLLLVLPPVWFVLRRHGSGLWKLPVSLALAPAFLLLILSVREIRWCGLDEAMAFAALAPMFAALTRTPSCRRRLRWIAAGCCGLLVSGVVPILGAAARISRVSVAEVRLLEERDLAYWLRMRMGSDRMVVLSTPTVTNHLIYYGGGSGLGTLYWENIEGLEHAAEIFSARSLAEAHALIRRFGVTHIVLVSWDDAAENLVRYYRRVPPARPTPTDTFLQILRSGGVPPWLRRLPYRMPDLKPLAGQFVIVLKVVPDQSPAAEAAHLVDYFLEMGQTGAAVRAARRLEQYPSNLQALVTLAGFQGQTGRSAAFAVTVNRVVDHLAGASGLGVGDRIRLAMVLAAGGREGLARAQFGRVLAELDERALRRLSSGRLRDLHELTRVLGMEIPDARLRRLALSLYPPMLRGASGGKPPPAGS